MKGSAMLWAFVLLFCVIHNINAEKAKILVTRGMQKCLSECTFEPFGTDRYFGCSVDECKNLPRSLNPAERPEIEKTVTLYIYTDTITGENNLRLEFSWTPSDDRTVEELTGYLIEVKDNNEKSQASYTRCYNITTPLSFRKHIKTLFKDDCYGTYNSVKIKPGSKLTVSVTSLPLFDSNVKNTMNSITVQIPSCNDPRLADLTACKSTGRSVKVMEATKQCAQNCSINSIGVDGLPHYIVCTTSKPNTDIFLHMKPETCDTVNKTVSGTPSPPDEVTGRENWYIYYDPVSGETKVALNFSWSPADDSSISSLVGYYMEILEKTAVGTSNYYNKCFTIHTVLNEDDHKAAEFFYDCYGRDTMEVKPGDEFLVHLESKPAATSKPRYTSFNIDVPDCAHERMQNVTYCTAFNRLYREGEVEKVFCNNRSIQFTYALAPEYGDWATVLLCEKGEGLSVCKNVLAEYNYLALNGTLYNISIASNANLSIGYVTLLYGNKVPDRTPTDVSFKECISPISDPMLFAIIFVVVAFVIFSVIVLFLCLWRRTNCSPSKILGKYLTCCVKAKGPAAQDTTYTNGQVNDSSSATGLQVITLPLKEPAKIPDLHRVYVIFKEDHPMHRDTVYLFCCYLKKDLGMDVRICLWEEILASANPIAYMDTNLAQAHKVIIICSEGTRNSLSDQDWKVGDMFTPVLRKIYQESFLGKNPGKFLIGYFDYSSAKDVPAMLHDQAAMYCSVFKLMKQFEQFYFRLIGVEQFQEGGINRIEKIAFDRYHDIELTSYGWKLKSSIERMKEFVSEHPTWYVDNEGEDMAVVDVPSMPPSDYSVPEMPSINMLHISHPPEMTGARPKKISNSQQDSRIEINEELDTDNPSENDSRNESPIPTTQPKRIETQAINVDRAMSETRVKELYIEPDPPVRWPTEHEDDDDPALIPSVEFTSMSDYGSSRPLFNSNISQGTSFCLASDFSNRSRPDDSDSFLLDELPSQETQITRLGLPESSEFPQVPETNSLMNMSVPPLIHHKDEVPAESGVFTFTQIEECELADFEDQIKSINQMPATSELELQNVGLEAV